MSQEASRSIRIRVVVTIVLLGAVVAGSVGWLLVQQISDGLVDGKVAAARAEADSETLSARDTQRCRAHASSLPRAPDRRAPP